MIHLHVHDAMGSLLDATIRPADLPKRAKELGMSAVAITNHGYMTSVVQFYEACKEHNVKPIIGCELYTCFDMSEQDPNDKYDHLVVLAKNQAGYNNLLKLSSLGFIDGFYYKPRVDKDALFQHSEGLIGLSACLAGEIPRLIMSNAPEQEIVNAIELHKKIFEEFYLEMQAATSPEQELVNKRLVALSQKTNTPLVVTTDAHFLKKEDHYMHGLFIQMNQDRDNQVYKDCWLKTDQEVGEVLIPQVGIDATLEAIANTHYIAEKCDVEIELGNSYLPHYDVPDGNTEDNYLRKLVHEGFHKRNLTKLPEEEQQIYLDRLEEELEIITKKGFSGYFLIVKDFLDMCRENGIYVGDGRGSADNSLVCYVTGITNVDSIKYKLNFSRFLTLERTSLPDIDMDLQSSQRQRAIQLIRDKYGHENVAQICTFSTLQDRACLAAVGKVLGVTYKEIERIRKLIPESATIAEALQGDEKLQREAKRYPELFEATQELVGLPRSISVHAGGVVVCPSDRSMNEFTGLALSKDKEVITQLDMHDVEKVGLVKIDCLATITLDVIADTLDLVFKEVG